MAEPSPLPSEQELLTRLVDLHQHDELAPEHHAALVQRLTSFHALPLPSARVDSIARRRNPNRYLFGSLGAGVLVAAAWALWFRPVPLSPEPVRGSSNDGIAVQRLSVQANPCVLARGGSASLWHPGSAGVDAPAEDGRFGSWVHFRNNGQQGLREPVQVLQLDMPVPAQPALRVEGPATQGWGAKLTIGMRARSQGNDGGHFECYNASAYRGLRFRASGTGIVQVVLQTSDSIPVELGGRCTDKCWFSSSHAIALGSAFQDFEIPWHQFGPDDTETTVVPQLMAVDFVVQATDSPYAFTLARVGFMSK